MAVKIYIEQNQPFSKAVQYVFTLIAENKNIQFDFVKAVPDAAIRVTSDASGDFIPSKKFYQKLEEKKFSYSEHFDSDCVVKGENGNPDLLSTIFYCVNSIQEMGASVTDEFGRFSYAQSYQASYGNISINYVQELIDRICIHRVLAHELKPARKSKLFLSHDIDTVYGAWKEDGFFAAKKMQLGKMFSLMLRQAMDKPDWLNMDRIMKIESGFDFTSTFYWLLYKDGQNSDYDYKSEKIQRQVSAIANSRWENGLHKSLRKASFREELDRLGVKTEGNRFHYLHFTVPDGYAKIEASGLKLDTSLGFSEQWGFRNSYGLPFMPFSLEKNKVFDMIEVPMQVMDRTFFSRKIPVTEVKKLLIDWFEKNKFNCVFALNFHNNFFSDFKYGGYTELYKSLLSYFRESGIESMSQRELIREFYRPEKYNSPV